MTIERLHIRSSFIGLFGKHITKIVADGVHVVMPPLGTETGAKPASDIVVGELVAKDAVIEFSRKNLSDPRIQFLARQAVVQESGSQNKNHLLRRGPNAGASGRSGGQWNARSF